MFYTLKINALLEERNLPASEAGVIIKFNKSPQHGKIHFIALDHKMTSNIYRQKTGQEAENYEIEITCYDKEKKVAYLNSRKVVV